MTDIYNALTIPRLYLKYKLNTVYYDVKADEIFINDHIPVSGNIAICKNFSNKNLLLTVANRKISGNYNHGEIKEFGRIFSVLLDDVESLNAGILNGIHCYNEGELEYIYISNNAKNDGSVEKKLFICKKYNDIRISIKISITDYAIP
jgi:hypothetical protein